MRKTTLEFDETKREQVAEILGTEGLKATVDAAFDYVLGGRAFDEFVEAVKGGLFELDNEAIETRAWAD